MNNTEINQRKEPGSNGQYYVVFRNSKEWRALFKWLNENGFSNFHNLSKWKSPKYPPAISIDKKLNSFGLINVCCLAAATSCGYYAISCDDFYRIFKRD